jgi:serine/threonine protein kinase
MKRSESVIQPDLFHYQEHFQFLGLAGKTATSEVFKVKHKTTGELFAIKRSRRRFRSKLQRQRCLREIRSVIALPLHPHIVGQHRAWQEGGHFYIQMDFAPNGSLQQLLKKTSSSSSLLSDQAMWSIAWEVTSGLLFLHTNGVMHLDIKPDNIYFDVQGRCRIGDFGLAVVGTDVSDWEEGDGDYLAPELLGPRAEPSPKADIFSLGATLYECATGRKIDRTHTIDGTAGTGDDNNSNNSSNNNSNSNTALLPGRPEKMNELVSLMLAGDAAVRPSAEEVLHFMRDIGVAGQEVELPPASSSARREHHHDDEQMDRRVALPEQQQQQDPGTIIATQLVSSSLMKPVPAGVLMSPATGFSSLRLDCHTDREKEGEEGVRAIEKEWGTQDAVIIREVNKPALSPFQQADLNSSPSLFAAGGAAAGGSPVAAVAVLSGSPCDPSPLAAEFSFGMTEKITEDKENTSSMAKMNKIYVQAGPATTPGGGAGGGATVQHNMKWVPSLSPLISEPGTTPGGESTTIAGEAATPLLVQVQVQPQSQPAGDGEEVELTTRKHRRDSPDDEYDLEDADNDDEEEDEEGVDDDDEIVYNNNNKSARAGEGSGGGGGGGGGGVRKMRRPPVPLLPPIIVPPPTSGRRSAAATGVSGGRLNHQQQQPLSALHSSRTQQDSFRLHKRDLIFSPDSYDVAMETESASESEPCTCSCGSGRTMSLSDMEFADVVSPAPIFSTGRGAGVVGRLPLGAGFAGGIGDNLAVITTTPSGGGRFPSFLNAPAPTPDSSYNSEEEGVRTATTTIGGRGSSSSSPEDLAKSLSAKSHPRSFVVPPHALQWELHMSPELILHLPPGSPRSPSITAAGDGDNGGGGRMANATPRGGTTGQQATSRSTSMRRFPTLDSLSNGGMMMTNNGGSGVVGIMHKQDSSSSQYKDGLDILLAATGGGGGMPPVPPLVLNIGGGEGDINITTNHHNNNLRRKRQHSSRRALVTALSTENSGQLASSRSMDGMMPLTSKARHHSARGDLKAMALAAAAAAAASDGGGDGSGALETARRPRYEESSL